LQQLSGLGPQLFIPGTLGAQLENGSKTSAEPSCESVLAEPASDRNESPPEAPPNDRASLASVRIPSLELEQPAR
jgi:hypothetical protein